MKGKVLIPSAIIIFVLYVLTLFLEIGNFSLYNIWFSLLIFYLSIYVFIYAYLYKLDSALYYAVLLLSYAIATFYRYIIAVEYKNFYPIYLLCFSIAHLAVFVVFRQYIHFKLFAILSLECILLISYKINYITIWSVIQLNVLFILFIFINFVYRLRKNLRRE